VTFPRLEMLESSDYYKEALIIEETNEIIYQAICKLSPQGKEVIELSLDGLKNEEIARELGISINTVKTIKQRAFKFLRKELKENVFALFLILKGQKLNSSKFSS
jgi:RNA polymerase sigma-70 factor (ECF subfamily)